ncbi:MAG TPA: hypothetical protein VN802_05255 [Stellaceae bacterium]|nr:hypothetical protein [Stellaceae bacterium]
MAGRRGAQPRPGWALEPDLHPVDEHLRRRSWRVLRAALPSGRGLDPLPGWVTCPDDFIDWLTNRVSTAAVRGYFEHLELIAKQICDLELLRFVRHHKAQV